MDLFHSRRNVKNVKTIGKSGRCPPLLQFALLCTLRYRKRSASIRYQQSSRYGTDALLYLARADLGSIRLPGGSL